MRTRKVVLGMAAITFIIMSDSAAAQTGLDLLRPGGYLTLGVGYHRSSGDIRNVCGDGYALNFQVGYRPWRAFGLDVEGVFASTGITDLMKNRISIYYPATGDYGKGESSGGDAYTLHFGPSYFIQIGGSDFVFSLGAGGSYGGTRESGVSNIEGYTPRWTFGWGYYARVGVNCHSRSGNLGFIYGIKVEYAALHAKVNDFYYDRFFGKSGYDEIPATYVWDGRLNVSLNFGLEFN